MCMWSLLYRYTCTNYVIHYSYTPTLCTYTLLLYRCPAEQKEVYYLVSPSRTAALQSPYMETFLTHNKEVLLLYTTIDDFVMGNLNSYNNRKLVSIEKSNIDFDNDAKEAAAASKEGEKEGVQEGEKGKNSDHGDKGSGVTRKLTETEITEVCGWLKLTLGMYSHTHSPLHSYTLTDTNTLTHCILLYYSFKTALNKPKLSLFSLSLSPSPSYTLPLSHTLLHSLCVYRRVQGA